jgi:hypothetical protein
MAKLHLSLQGVSWPLIEVLAQVKSPIQSRMMFLDLYEANFDKLRLIMDVSFPPGTSSERHFILIMCSLTLNQWMQRTQIFINQGTSRLDAGG